MDPRARSFAIAGGGAVSGVGLLVYGWRVLVSLPEPQGDGFAAGMAGLLLLVWALSALIVLFDALLLAGSEWLGSLGRWQRHLLQTGVRLSALGPLVLIALPLSLSVEYDLFAYQYGAWGGLIGLGTVLCVVGTLWALGSGVRGWWVSRSRPDGHV